MIKVKCRDDHGGLVKYLEGAKSAVSHSTLSRTGKKAVEALKKNTPVDTGLTANSWFYKISKGTDYVAISFHNSNIQNGVLIAVILQYGHTTRQGGYVQGRDYINPALKPIFDAYINQKWREVTNK